MKNSITSFFSEAETHLEDSDRYRVGNTDLVIRPTHNADGVYLQGVFTSPPDRQVGCGNSAMQWLCELADRHQIDICLTVESLPENIDWLLAWYWQLGFRGDVDEMIREPIEQSGCAIR